MTGQRYPILDALKGLAMVGVVLVNATTMNGPYWMDMEDYAFQKSYLDSLITTLSFTFIIPPFYPLFPLTFGLSASLMMEHLRQKSLPVASIFLKRSGLLALLGSLHIALFFWGDVLLVYAVLSVLLLAFSRLSYKKAFVVSLCCFLLTVIFNTLLQGQGDSEEYEGFMISAYRSGSFSFLIGQRLSDYYEWYLAGLFQMEDILYFLEYLVYYAELLAFMTTGFAIAKYRGHFGQEAFQVKKLLGTAAILIISLGLLEALAFEPLSSIYGLLFALLYASLFSILYLKMGTRFQRVFSSMGRMSLTWYLGASGLMSVILHGYGLGLYGKIGPATTTTVAALYLISCFALGPLWLRRFRQGPVETVWRFLAYSKSLKQET